MKKGTGRIVFTVPMGGGQQVKCILLEGGICKIAHFTHMGCQFTVGDGKGILFWHDNWYKGTPLTIQLLTSSD